MGINWSLSLMSYSELSLRAGAEVGQMNSALDGENLSGAQGSQTSCIFITDHREFPGQEINTCSLFIVGAGVESSWQLVEAVLKDSFRNFLHRTGLPPSFALALFQLYWVLYKDSPYLFPWSQK